jgi:hypothetical protein
VPLCVPPPAKTDAKQPGQWSRPSLPDLQQAASVNQYRIREVGTTTLSDQTCGERNCTYDIQLALQLRITGSPCCGEANLFILMPVGWFC